MPKAFSYRLQARMEPNWQAIIKKVVGLSTEQEQRAFEAKLRENPQGGRMLDRTYDFTEFFDSSTGLTTRFQRTNLPNQSYCNFVDEFADRGYLLGWDSPFMPEEGKAKYAIEVTEHWIRNECFDPFIGGPRPSMDGDLFFVIPIDAIVAFAVALQLRFPNVSTRQIVKWPEKIDSAMRKTGLIYEARFGDEPTLMQIEKEDSKFFSEHGCPEIATIDSFPSDPYFEGECGYYHFNVEVFTPDRARNTSRLAHTALLG